MTRKVSVVVPVFNPGAYIDPLIESLLHQSMPSSDFEAIFVDDGSTDETPMKLDTLAARHPHMRVIHIPNSGWPGRPRNIGIDEACGEYVQFVDNDDVLGLEALERLHAYATENRADVVVGKEVRTPGEWSLWSLFDRNRPDARLRDDPLLGLLSPHKMFRRAFLLDHDIRFFEGPRRLEDHPFVVRSFFLAERISVLSDYPVYYWTQRKGNAGSIPEDWAAWYGFMRDALDVVEEFTEPGDWRDRLLSHWYRTKGLGMALRVVGNPRNSTGGALFSALQQLVDERFPPPVDAALPPWHRMASALVRTGDQAALERLGELHRSVTIAHTVDSVEVVEGRLRLEVTAALTFGAGRSLTVRREGGRSFWQPPVDIGVPSELLDLGDAQRTPSYDLILRHRGSAECLVIPGTVIPPGPDTTGGGPCVHSVVFHVDPRHGPFDKPLPPGVHDVSLRAGYAGIGARTRVALTDAPGATLAVLTDTRSAAVAVTDAQARLAVELGPPARRHVLKDLAPRPGSALVAATEHGGVRVVVPLDGPPVRGRAMRFRAELRRHDGASRQFPMVLQPASPGSEACVVLTLDGDDLPGLRARSTVLWELHAVAGKRSFALGLSLAASPDGTVRLVDHDGAEVTRTRITARGSGVLNGVRARLRQALRS